MREIPVYILSGFLGSGKTTLLTKILAYSTARGLRPAVIMNEVGDVNLDGQLVDETVPMREMFSGCICCTIRGDLDMELRQLVQEESPDLIFIEATGVANPMEILDAITDAALLVKIEIQAVLTVMDAAHYLHWHRKGKGKTYRLMEEQVRCASLLLLNKSDLVTAQQLEQLQQIATSLNPKAQLHATIQCFIDPSVLEQLFTLQEDTSIAEMNFGHGARAPQCDGHDHPLHDESCKAAHHSYDHVMVYTHYFDQPINLGCFQQMFEHLPAGVYRAKGIVTVAGTDERMMFQYAYQHLELIPIQPQGKVQDVAVLIGEQFSKQLVEQQLAALTSM